MCVSVVRYVSSPYLVLHIGTTSARFTPHIINLLAANSTPTIFPQMPSVHTLRTPSRFVCVGVFSIPAGLSLLGGGSWLARARRRRRWRFRVVRAQYLPKTVGLTALHTHTHTLCAEFGVDVRCAALASCSDGCVTHKRHGVSRVLRVMCAKMFRLIVWRPR